jgi:diguanylate cyclase (GGDEF)-like protein
VTVSIGTALLGENDKVASDLIQRADEKLYEAKRGGRNRVCS